jgi:hypothetical protein
LVAAVQPLPGHAQGGPPGGAPPLPQPGTPDRPTLVTADEAMALDRERMRSLLETDCPPIRLDDEVVVCGRRPDYRRFRVPMAGPDVSRGTRERSADAQLHALEAGSNRCSAVGRDQTCGGGLDLIGIGFTIVRGIAQALANRD